MTAGIVGRCLQTSRVGGGWWFISRLLRRLERSVRDPSKRQKGRGTVFWLQVRVGETHGVKFPREFGLLLKQLLYFDRYGAAFVYRPSALFTLLSQSAESRNLNKGRCR